MSKSVSDEECATRALDWGGISDQHAVRGWNYAATGGVQPLPYAVELRGRVPYPTFHFNDPDGVSFTLLKAHPRRCRLWGCSTRPASLTGGCDTRSMRDVWPACCRCCRMKTSIHLLIANALLTTGPEEAITLPLPSIMFTVVSTAELGFEPAHAMPVNCAVPKFAKTD
jgi:hypothetical protein